MVLNHYSNAQEACISIRRITRGPSDKLCGPLGRQPCPLMRRPSWIYSQAPTTTNAGWLSQADDHRKRKYWGRNSGPCLSSSHGQRRPCDDWGSMDKCIEPRVQRRTLNPWGQGKLSSTLASLDPVKFNYKTDASEKHLGFIAEDVPDLVATKTGRGLSPRTLWWY